MVSNFLSHKKYDGSMKLKLKDTSIQTNLLQNLSVICTTEARVLCKKKTFESKLRQVWGQENVLIEDTALP